MIRLGARSSPLSRAQVQEVLEALFFPAVETLFVETKGDLDKKTSLRTLEKTDFFTDAVDRLVLSHQIDVGVHSAKDLPDPLPEGLELFALTKGIDPRDSLVFRDLKSNALIATSSERREEAVQALFSFPLRFTDVRGTIQERLSLLEQHKVDGVVIAEAALLRLKLNPPRLLLPGAPIPLQGKLAIVGRKGDKTTAAFFTSIDAR